MKNKCLHCNGKGYTTNKQTYLLHPDCFKCETCNGTGFSNKHIHKSCRSRYDYPVCDVNCNNHEAMVTRNWKIVTCPSCLKLRKQ